MTADPWYLAALIHTICALSRRQEPGWDNPPACIWSLNQNEHLQAALHGSAIRAKAVPDLHTVAQRGRRNPKWVVCTFGPADAQLVVRNSQRLLGPKATICVANCASVIVKALRLGNHHTLVLQARLRDHAKAGKAGVWPVLTLLPIDLELQLAVPTTVYHWLEAFDQLQWRSKPDRQVSPTHLQEWLQADEQHAAIRHLGPPPGATGAPDVSAPGGRLAPQTVPLAN